MGDLRCIVYVSAAVHLLSQAELDRLLDGARTRNATAEVTGLLLHADGSFMQYIEGPAEPLERIYAAIVADPLHGDIIELLNESIDEREFADWAMAFNQATTPDFLQLRTARWTRQVPSERLGPGRETMKRVWNPGQG